jgi:capsular polysaccharide biosynthesis protein
MTGSALVKDYRELVKSKLVTTAVINELSLKDISPSQLAGMISVGLKSDTRVIQISILDTNPERAMDIANKIGEVFKSKVVELMKADNVEIVDKAQKPSVPVSPRPYHNMSMALFIGFIIGIGVAFLLEYLDDTIKTSDDVEKQLGLAVLGTIPVFNLK